MLRTVLIILLILLILGLLPSFGLHSWGYGPSGGVGLVLIILLVLILAEKL